MPLDIRTGTGGRGMTRESSKRLEPRPKPGILLRGRGSTLDGAAAQEALSWCSVFPQRVGLNALESIHAISAQTGLKRPEALPGVGKLAELLESIETTLSNYAPVIYEQNLQGILHDLSPAHNGGLAAARRSPNAKPAVVRASLMEAIMRRVNEQAIVSAGTDRPKSPAHSRLRHPRFSTPLLNREWIFIP